VSLDGSPGQGRRKPRKPPRVVPIIGSIEVSQRLQELGTILATSVRSIMQDSHLAEGLLRRLHEQWLEQDLVLELQPTEVRAGGRLVLGATAQAGRFILRAYGAGLRMLALRRQSTLADMIRLVTELAALESDELEPQQFANWLWRGGALGFDVVQVEALTEIGQGLIDALDAAEYWSGRSQHAIHHWNEVALAAAAALPAPALAQRFGGPLQRLQERALRTELSLTVEEALSLREAADDVQAFARAELGVLVQYPALRHTLSGDHVSVRLCELIAGGAQPDPRLLGLFGLLDAAGRRLDRMMLGEAVARRLLAHPYGRSDFAAFADQADAQILSGLFFRLADPEEGATDAALLALTLLLQHWGAERFFAHLDPTVLSPQLAASLLHCACEAQAPAAVLISVITNLRTDAALHALMTAPELVLKAPMLFQSLIATNPHSSGPVLAQLVQLDLDIARSVGAAVCSRLAAGFREEHLDPTLAALVHEGLGEQFVLPLWEARGASSSTRLCALHALARDAELIALAQQRRPLSKNDPRELREAMEALRWGALE
jgi:hypothetical protein